VSRLRPLGIAVGEVTDLGTALDGDLAAERHMVVSLDTNAGPLRLVGSPVKIDGSPPQYRLPPRLHEHNGEVLGEWRDAKERNT
jgi:crotonobetainyl-CoA:carnitine CoA-transferase CaiB-like acyl-CoA transferase